MSAATVQGGCQCGENRFEATFTKGIESGFACNCSRCEKTGWILGFVDGDKEFKVLKKGELTEWLFNTKKIKHLFCSKCGIESYAFGPSHSGPGTTAMINLRCLDSPPDFKSIKIIEYDGKKA